MAGRKLYPGHAHFEVFRVQYHLNQKDGVSSNFPKSPAPSSSSGMKISPAVLFIIVILAVLFFICGFLHLLVRFLTKKPSSAQSNRNLEDSASDAIQRQLQQLFNLHDSGLDQAFIDALPVFSYKEILGPRKEHFDCSVCLCEFTETDRLRLLPTCSHAFHLSCIETWLLSNSTCPLCRGALVNPGFANPIFDYDDFREEDGDKRDEIAEVGTKNGIFHVRLGKFRKLGNNVENGEIVEESSSSKLDARRCYSMGSYEYVVGDANLRVALSCDQGASDKNKVTENESVDGKKICIGTKKDSYSVSKIWLWSKRGKYFESSSDDRLENSPPNLDLSWMHRK